MNPKEIVLIGSLPPPYTGQSVSFYMLVKGIGEYNLKYKVVNLARKTFERGGQLTFRRAIECIGILFGFIRKASGGYKVVYITIAQSRHGFFRDLPLIWFAWFNNHQIVCHLKGGNYDNFYRQQPRWLQWLIRKTLLKVDIILVLGEQLRKMFDFEPRLKERVHVVFNGLPFSISKEIKYKELPENQQEPIHILYLSNLIESKGYFDLLEAVKILVQEYQLSVQCHFCGMFIAHPSDDICVKIADQAKFMFDDFVKKHELTNYVHYHGVVIGEDKESFLLKAHFFVLPTNYDNEGQPVSIIEAMAYANVVISTDYRAIPDMVVDKQTGFLVPYAQPRAIADRIKKLVMDPKRYVVMSQAARQRYENLFTRRAHLNNLIHFLVPNSETV